ncbi:hypothetical protein BIV25_05645 [Streptomyces sp. MUSC 14]|uniref:hypothetical protein n=1 Tax=Streptomyces sp. MUSC 14 TaxID=1354889 RepID=UPI0008F5E138|nr:hypothetical protein [Streptomyces sp. MUSC 14]OIK01456.1 hypothetical protein BIV25_05645 [Streptomyces sp. MUSC 14]
MGAFGRIGYGARGPRVAGAVGVVVVAGGALAGCQPTDLNSSSAAYTTGTTATAELKQRHVDVSWLSCTGNYGGKGKAGTPAPTETTVVSVECQGETRSKKKITVTGRVTKAVDGACVRGSLTARVGGRQVFHVSGLGDCSATPGPTYTPPTYHPGGGQPTVTVTVTRTLWCKGDPTCWPVQGK